MNTNARDKFIATEVLGYQFFNTGDRPHIVKVPRKFAPVLEPLPHYSTDEGEAFKLLKFLSKEREFAVSLTYSPWRKIWTCSVNDSTAVEPSVTLAICKAIIHNHIIDNETN